MPLDDFYNKIVALEEFNIEVESIDIINKYGYYLVGLLRKQLQEGKDADGKSLLAKYGSDYSDYTVFNKERRGVSLGKETGYVTYFMTGAFYTSLEVIAAGDTFSITSPVPYLSSLEAFSGSKRFLELNQEHLTEFSEEILVPQLQLRLNAALNK